MVLKNWQYTYIDISCEKHERLFGAVQERPRDPRLSETLEVGWMDYGNIQWQF